MAHIRVCLPFCIVGAGAGMMVMMVLKVTTEGVHVHGGDAMGLVPWQGDQLRVRHGRFLG